MDRPPRAATGPGAALGEVEGRPVQRAPGQNLRSRPADMLSLLRDDGEPPADAGRVRRGSVAVRRQPAREATLARESLAGGAHTLPDRLPLRTPHRGDESDLEIPDSSIGAEPVAVSDEQRRTTGLLPRVKDVLEVSHGAGPLTTPASNFQTASTSADPFASISRAA